MQKIAIFGGAFNPIHCGHLHLILHFDTRLKFQKVLLIPSHISPHKDSSALIAGQHRLAMCSLVAEHYEHFSVSDIELCRDGKSYTYDTICQLRKEYPDGKFYLIVGSDMFLSLDTWYRASELVKMVTVCAAAREKDEYEALLKKQQELDTLSVQSVVSEIDVLSISSTEIRERIRKGQSVEGLLPEYVEEYIYKTGLYQTE